MEDVEEEVRRVATVRDDMSVESVTCLKGNDSSRPYTCKVEETGGLLPWTYEVSTRDDGEIVVGTRM
jgi:hypothetical protein